MAIEKFDLSSLSTIDEGRIREAFEQALKRARDDCSDRPALAKPRKVNLTATLTPVCDPNGSLSSVTVQFEIEDKLPKRMSNKYDMAITRGGLLFNELSKDDIHQQTLDDAPTPKATEEPQEEGIG